MGPHVNALVATLDLVFTPIPNSRVSSLTKLEGATEMLRESNLYMIGGRAKARYTKLERDEHGNVVFEMEVLGGPKGRGTIDVSAIPSIAKLGQGAAIGIGISESGEAIAFFNVEDADNPRPLTALHAEEILWRRGRKEEFIGGLDNHLELATYDLLYVGIATQTDSYSRLMEKGHEARQRILSDEPQRYPGARVSDEIFLFLFKADPLLIRSWRPEDRIEDHDLVFSYNDSRLVSDAEKAFVSILKPKYNSQLYKNYPRGRDGIYHECYTGYSYSLSDGIAFRTPFGRLKGARERDFTMSNDADFISIRGDAVTLHISGVDFEVSATPIGGATEHAEIDSGEPNG